MITCFLSLFCLFVFPIIFWRPVSCWRPCCPRLYIGRCFFQSIYVWCSMSAGRWWSRFGCFCTRLSIGRCFIQSIRVWCAMSARRWWRHFGCFCTRNGDFRIKLWGKNQDIGTFWHIYKHWVDDISLESWKTQKNLEKLEIKIYSIKVTT